MQIAIFCVILRRNSFSIIERSGFHLFNDVEKPAASGSYLKLSAFENMQFLEWNYSYFYAQSYKYFIMQNF